MDWIGADQTEWNYSLEYLLLMEKEENELAIFNYFFSLFLSKVSVSTNSHLVDSFNLEKSEEYFFMLLEILFLDQIVYFGNICLCEHYIRLFFSFEVFLNVLLWVLISGLLTNIQYFEIHLSFAKSYLFYFSI